MNIVASELRRIANEVLEGYTFFKFSRLSGSRASGIVALRF